MPVTPGDMNWTGVLWTTLVTVVGAFAALWAQGAPVNRGMRSALYATILFVGFLLGLVGVLGVVFPGSAPAGLIVPGLVVCLPVWPRFRRALARLLPIDPASATHMVALIVVLVTLLFGAVKLSPNAGGEPAPLTPVSPSQAITAGLALAVFSLFAVGLGLRRTWAGALDRLGLARPSLLRVGLGVLTAAGLAALALGLRAVTPPGAPPTDVLTLALATQAGGPLGGIAVALGIALGTELFFRGALQPRIGLPVTALAFLAAVFFPPLTLGHLALVALALALGALRRWADTTTCIIAHALYGGALALAPLLLP